MLRATQLVENTFHLYRPLGWTYANLIQACEDAYTLWSTWFKPAIPSNISLYNIHGQVYDPNGSPWVYDRSVSPPLAGTLTGTDNPGNVTVTLSERANLAGRAYRGRVYWPGLVQAHVAADDTLTSTALIMLANVAVQWLAQFPITGGTGALVIFHRLDNLFSTVQSIVLEKVVDSMRRRLPGRGA
jgi:hypothetical protein